MSGKKILPLLKIITVDDSPIVAERVQALLSDMDNVAFLGNASNMSAALLLINQQKPHVVILDIHLGEEMPKANGMNLLITLRKQYAEMKIMMFTNLTEPQYRSSCIAFGADYFFDKSNDFDKISEALKEIAQSANK
jgi:DNA-binding NarL/FixJ family response regulator